MSRKKTTQAKRVNNTKRSSAARPAPKQAQSTAAEVRLARVPKGRKPQYFSDPAIDKLLSMTMTLVAELSVARDRIDTLERLLEKHRVFKASDVDGYVPTPDVEAARDARRATYIARVLRAMQSELEETTNSAMPRSQEDVVAAVSS